VEKIFVLVCGFGMGCIIKTCLGKILNFYKVFGDFSEILWKKIFGTGPIIIVYY